LALVGIMVEARTMFSVGGYQVPYPGHSRASAAQGIHCCCTVLNVLEERPTLTLMLNLTVW
jgi:hypothetical protein